jgi:hypothetical protein
MDPKAWITLAWSFSCAPVEGWIKDNEEERIGDRKIFRQRQSCRRRGRAQDQDVGKTELMTFWDLAQRSMIAIANITGRKAQAFRNTFRTC